ncbi:MAG: porin family protein, partial [Bacteroidota bacterium]
MKTLFSTALIILCLSFGFSQETSYGVRIAYNISNLDFEPDATFENKHRNGMAFAGFVDFGLTESISLLTELQYSAEGGKEEPLRADYIQMPIQLRFSIAEDLKIGLGPQVSLKTWEDKDGFSTFAFSGVGGLEYMITDEIFIDARYSYGITNIL